MSFVATIDDSENKLFLCKVINTLNQFNNSEEIKFTITEKTLKLSVFNRTLTSYGEVIFDKDFFGTYEFHSDGFNDEGVSYEHTDEGTEMVYSFLVRARVLALLFKQDPGVDSYKISLKSSGESQLKVEIRNTNMIRKEYNPFYVPFKDEKLKVAQQYKASFQELVQKQYQNDAEITDVEEINYLMISNDILKGFLDNISSNTEDFKIEASSKKFSMTGYTRKISNKDENQLRQAMDINISFKINELIDFKLFNDANSCEKAVVFRLKDFKNFLNLGLNSETVEIWFRVSGDPILFEMNKLNCKIQFVQVTDPVEGRNTNIKVTKLFKNEVIVNTDVLRTNPKLPRKDPLFVQDEDVGDVEFATNTVVTPEYDFKDNEEDDEPRDDGPIVGWNNDDDLRVPTITKTKQQFLREEKKDYINQLNKRQKVASEEQEIGPTQDVAKIKGIFD